MAHKKLVRPKCGCKLRDTGADVSYNHLGDGADGSEEHPIVLTEAPCNPLHSSQMMSVLLFECYRVPNAVVGDSSKSHPVKYYFNKSWMHVNVGRSQAVSYLQRLLQLKYTGHLAAVTLCLIESCSKNTATQPMTTTKSWRSGTVQSSMSRRCTACSCPSLPRFWAAW
uniref:actin-related protein 5-like isoform X1 n=1 Tax=Oncorhynchus gorbuscha TaxID=8017 RepID=UPI001EAEC7D7|nr:actin-related protein 5-like isoform X1 [Oncorhynchus gorbuscha]